jgi:hypothetical protein
MSHISRVGDKISDEIPRTRTGRISWNFTSPPRPKRCFDKSCQLGINASEDELLRDALASLSEADDDWAAIEEGLTAIDHPESWIPLDVADAELRAKLQIPPP